MIRQLRLSDLPRQLLPGRLTGPDLAFTREAMAGNAPRLSLLELARWTMPPIFLQQPLALIEGFKIRALAVVRARAGLRSWELSHLYPSSVAAQHIGELLEWTGAQAASQGGERLFLRLEAGSPLEVVARRSGFFPGFIEEVFERRGPREPSDRTMHLQLRPPSVADQYGLFRLYNAAVPASVRSMSGLTLDQWRDSQERPLRRVTEYVWDRDGEIAGWLRMVRHEGMTTVDALLHPREADRAFLVCEEAARLVGDDEAIAWLVPGYQPAMAWGLRKAGWQATNSYAVLIRTLAKGVRELSMSPARA